MTLVDRFGRTHRSLRISVTDRCNIRCSYCMPIHNVTFLPRKDVLSFEEIESLADVAIELGITKVRITGGEPLVRKNLPWLIQRLSSKGLKDLALTTNGILLAEHAQELYDAGLMRLNVSLDSLSPSTFEQIARRPGLDRVLAGIEAAQSVGFKGIRINAVPIRDVNDVEIGELARFCREHHLHLRFIEFMPLDAENKWNGEQVVRGQEIIERISKEVGALRPVERLNVSQPAVDYEYIEGGQQVGFINTVSQPFCSGCDRLRLTAEGQLRNCLFGTQSWNVRDALRAGQSVSEIKKMFVECVQEKKFGHGIDAPEFQRPDKTMHQIGG
ncbi:MAG: GTP 3',8-cyclase MoaA [Pirellulaceae bacterium]